MKPYPSLFSPITLAGRRLRNRIVHPSMTTVTAAEGRVTDKLIQYHLNRARGGAAMLVTEPLATVPHQKIKTRVRAWNDHDEAGLKRWAALVEAEDCRLIGQIQDAGRGRHAPGRNYEAIGASALPDDISWTMPHVLTAEEIEGLIENFSNSARRLKSCGFSGVEISAGHGHLFHQFLSPYSNIRQDAYGGSFDGRQRLMRELIQAIRDKCGDEFILGLKLPGNDGISGSIDPALAVQICSDLTRTRLADYVCFAQGAHHRSLEMHIPDGHAVRLPYGGLLRQLRQAATPVPIVALGRVNDPAQADGIVERGEAELVGVGRALITDPAWPRKAMRGQAANIRYCVSGNTCWKTIVGYQPIACDNNPRLATPEELDETFVPADAIKKIVVVGSGIAGLEAAWVAAGRGHEVTLLGRSAEVGGKLRQLVGLPGGEDLSSIYDYQFIEAKRFGVKFKLNQEASLASIMALKADEVVLATGSEMIWPQCLPAYLAAEGVVPDLRLAMAQIEGISAKQKGTAVIFDMDHTEGVYASAERLKQIFERVVILTPRISIAEDVALVTRQGIYRRFHELGIEVLVTTEPRWTQAFEDEARLEYASVYGGAIKAIENVSFFSYATPRKPCDQLFNELRERGVVTHLIGDCRVARNIVAATAEGYALGRAL